MRAEQVARAHQKRRAALAKRAGREVRKLWGRIDLANIVRSWQEAMPDVLTVVESAQTTAAASAGSYLGQLAEAYDLEDDGVAAVHAITFAGQASDGRPLDSLMFQPALTALTALKQGATEGRARASGAFTAELITRTQVADAGRAADQVAQTVRPQLGRWVRMLSLPSCSRCILLAGTVYAWDARFKRHSACDCTTIPAPEAVAGDLTTDPRAAFEAMSTDEQDKTFTAADAQAIRDGADIAQVVNARRGMTDAGITTTGTTRAGLAGQRLGARRGTRVVRLTPAAIYVQAAGDRGQALLLLRQNGYLI
ncbi:hypothetical protein GCM10010435_44280 [Winogradskya consettensis]|uniref:Capsid maturation protease n=1 Tax=Winogradskya consettensis TaxID=113560 RepID=A0A919T2Q4_9ACTN|nr:hypothetical protein [Actinoplanes consettensis]GIM82668.1 hypothetical protein Aco04nite_82670 [Actinoplanes consettensis]